MLSGGSKGLKVSRSPDLPPWALGRRTGCGRAADSEQRAASSEGGDSTTDSAAQQWLGHPRASMDERAASTLVGAESRGGGLELCRCCDTHLVPGARRYMREAEARSTGLARAIDYAARHESALQHIRPSGLKRPVSVAQGAWRTTKSISVNAQGASCTSSDGAAPSETGGRRASATAYKREGIPAPRARTHQRLGVPRAKESSHGWHGRGH